MSNQPQRHRVARLAVVRTTDQLLARPDKRRGHNSDYNHDKGDHALYRWGRIRADELRHELRKRSLGDKRRAHEKYRQPLEPILQR